MSNTLKSPLSIPSSPGVYTFYRGRTPLYIGKAANIKKRLISYFKKNVGEKTRKLMEEATKLEWFVVGSEIEALLEEAELIKKYRPRYNIIMRDDKSYFYAQISREPFPRIFAVHQSQRSKTARCIGPFTNGSALKGTLRALRKIFPYCTCRKPHKRPCLNSEIGRCPGFCCLTEANREAQIANRTEYQKNIKNVAAVLGGRKKKIVAQLKREMRASAGNQNFEKAAKLRDEIRGLENIFGHRTLLEAGRRVINWPKIRQTLRVVLKSKKNISRVEGYDISNISGQEATGSMVVFMDGAPAKSEYRKFKIKTVRQANDVAMLKEVIRRRLSHTEWPYPDLMLIDGGKAQLNAAASAVNDQLSIINHRPRIAALAKREEELYIKGGSRPIKLAALPSATAFFLQRVRDEAHRFAKKYHHKLREVSYRDQK